LKTLKDIAQAMDCHPRTARRWWHKLNVHPDVVGHGPNRWKDRTFNRLIELWETFYKSRGTTLQITRAKYAGDLFDARQLLLWNPIITPKTGLKLPNGSRTPPAGNASGACIRTISKRITS
jgi:hypothetical protein